MTALNAVIDGLSVVPNIGLLVAAAALLVAVMILSYDSGSEE